MITTFFVTVVATVVGSMPGVFISIAAGRRIVLRAERTRLLNQLRTLREPGGVMYDTRDWAGSIADAIVNAAPVGVSQFAPPTAGLKWILDADLVPADMTVDVAVLLTHVEKLQSLIANHVGTALPQGAPLTRIVGDEANLVVALARGILELAKRKQAHALDATPSSSRRALGRRRPTRIPWVGPIPVHRLWTSRR
jgi:hypothetical protein